MIAPIRTILPKATSAVRILPLTSTAGNRRFSVLCSSNNNNKKFNRTSTITSLGTTVCKRDISEGALCYLMASGAIFNLAAAVGYDDPEAPEFFVLSTLGILSGAIGIGCWFTEP